MSTPIAHIEEKASGPDSVRRRRVFFGISGALFLAIVVTFHAVLAPFVLGLLVAYVLAPVAEQLERVSIRGRRIPRWVAVVFMYLILVGGIAALMGVFVPRLVREIEKLGRELPRLAATARDEWIPRAEHEIKALLAGADVEVTEPEEDASTAAAEELASPADPRAMRIVPRADGSYDVVLPPKGIAVAGDAERGYRIQTGYEENAPVSAPLGDMLKNALQNGEQHAFALVQTVQVVVRAITRGVFVFSLTLMISAYLLVTKDKIFGFFRDMVRRERRGQYDDLLRRIDRGLAGVVRGQLLISLVNGALSGIGFYFLDLAYWPLLTVIATLLSVIPIFGAWLSSIPAVIVGLQQGFGVALLVVLWIVVIHQIEANILNPKIMGDSAKVHPVLVIFALLAGEHFFGILGALFAVPVLSVSQSLFLHFRMLALGIPSSNTIPPVGIDDGT